MFGIAWQLEVLLPLVARYSYDGGAGTFGTMSSALAAGSLLGGLYAASHPSGGDRVVALAPVALSGALFAAAATPPFPAALLLLAVAGGSGIVVAAGAARLCNCGRRPRCAVA